MPPPDICEAISEICVKDIVVGVLSGRGQQTQHNLYKSISIPLMLDSNAKKMVEWEYSFYGDYSLKQESAVDRDKEVSLQFFTGVEDGKYFECSVFQSFTK